MKFKYQSFLTQTAVEAGKVLLRYAKRKHTIKRKFREGIVTEADQASEALILKKILRKFPKSSIITEESGELHGNCGLTWVIDPLDGTTNYAHNFPWFCVSIAVQHEGETVAGVVHHPILRETFFAEKGKGSWLNKKRLRVSSQKRLEDALLGTGFYYSQGKQLQEELTYFGQLNTEALGVRRPGAAALDLAYVACGRYDGFWERGLKCWDVAAGFLLVSEAGGFLSDYKGNATDIFRSEVLASNRHLHQDLLKAFKPLP